jgi:hypothetical protein
LLRAVELHSLKSGRLHSSYSRAGIAGTAIIEDV